MHIVLYNMNIVNKIHDFGLASSRTVYHSMDLIRQVRKTGFTIAPEAGSQRLRDVINKNISEDDLVNIYRGVLLHDIGKMGVPDQILRKTGPLTDPEWVEMRKHPQYAFDLLAPIPYLRPALDIPYCHHEHWDGSGYPRGLKGEQIPLAARIFSIIDIWDALLSDRPYRDAWPEEKVTAYLKEISGKILDPKVVDAFLQMTSEEEN